MYNTDEGNVDQITKERNSIIIMGVFLAILAVFITATLNYGNYGVVYYVLYGLIFALGVKISKIYLFLTPRRKFGTVSELKDFKETTYTVNGGAGKLYGRRSAAITEVTLVIEFDNGKKGEYVFVYKGDLKILKSGDRVGIYRFLKMPVWA